LLGLRPAFIASLLKKVLIPNRREVRTKDGTFFVDIASNLGYPLLTTGSYEPGMVAVIKSLLGPGKVFVDLGANEGFFSVLASKMIGQNGIVIAVEPQTRLQPIIKQNISLNACKNVELLPFAVNDASQPVTLNISPDMNTGSTSAIRTTHYPLLKETVQGITLEEIFRRYSISNCDLLKIDIEGYEYEAIMGSADLFRSQRIKAIALELHPEILTKRNLSTGAITSFLHDCGYRLSPSFDNTVFMCGD